MIDNKELFLRTRMAMGDTHKTKYDDFEVCTALNTAVDILVTELTLQASPELIRRTEFAVDEQGYGSLPSSFVSLVSFGENGCVFDLHSDYDEKEPQPFTFWIEGEKIRVKAGEYTQPFVLVYHKHPGKVEEKDLDLDNSYLNVLAQIAANIRAGELTAAEEKAAKAVADRRYNKMGAIYNPPLWSERVNNG